jgi:endonuclease III related protein
MIAPMDATTLYSKLLAAYGPQAWWPADTPLEVVVGAVLTQNTAWHNVAIAIANLKQRRMLELDTLLEAPAEDVKAAIRPSGFYNIKYERLRNLLAFLAECGGLEAAAARPEIELRADLLGVRGVGEETADSILLYALGKPAFVVDNYTRRLLARLGHAWAERAPYAGVQAWFTQQMPREIGCYNQYHALIVQHAKSRCQKRPACAECALRACCPHNREMPDGQQPPGCDNV